jgi:carotenoid cleavage dioxygenase
MFTLNTLKESTMSTALAIDAPTAYDNLFLDGPFAPVKAEVTEQQLVVSGELPTDLNGLYVRNGPNPLKQPNPKKHHWFVGDGMVHGLRLQGGKALWYRNRWVGGNKLHKALGRPIIGGQPRGIFDTVNTNVYAHAGRIWASVEAGPVPIQLSNELTSVRHGLFDSASTLPFSAHPHLDPISGDLHAVCYDATKLNKLFYVRVHKGGQVDKVVTIPVKHGPMVHDCAITRTQVVVMDLPVTFSFWEILKRSTFPYVWNPKHPARVGLLPRNGDADDIRWLDVDPCYVFHACNAYDLPDGSVVMDVIAHKHMFDTSRVGPEADTAPAFERWTLPANGQRVIREVLSNRSQEFPRLNETLVGQPYRYAYATEFNVDKLGGQSILKHDLHTRQTTEHRFGKHQKPGEFVFVPRPSAQAEDNGWLIGYVFNLASQRGEFHVIDAQRMDAPAQAVVQIPVPIPMGFHGNWMGESALNAPPA